MNREEEMFTDAEVLRRKAEKKLKNDSKKINKPDNEPDLKKLLHELQVYQIELEMQNEELQKANETAEAALKEYTLLYDLAPMGIFTLDSDGQIHDLNFTGADMLGERRFSLVNSNFKLFVEDDSKQVFNDFFSNLYTVGAKHSCQVKLLNHTNSSSFVYIEGIVTGEDRKCLLSIIDISGFKEKK